MRKQDPTDLKENQKHPDSGLPSNHVWHSGKIASHMKDQHIGDRKTVETCLEVAERIRFLTRMLKQPLEFFLGNKGETDIIIREMEAMK